MTPSPKMTGYIRDQMGGDGEEKTTPPPKMTGYIRDQIGGMARRKREGIGYATLKFVMTYPRCYLFFGAERRGEARREARTLG